MRNRPIRISRAFDPCQLRFRSVSAALSIRIRVCLQAYRKAGNQVGFSRWGLTFFIKERRC